MVENIAKGWRAVDSLVAAGACIMWGVRWVGNTGKTENGSGYKKKRKRLTKTLRYFCVICNYALGTASIEK